MLNSRHYVRRVCLTLPLPLLGALAMACAESPIAPTEDDFVTEIFSGVLSQQGQSTHLFEVMLQGRVDATVLSLEPLTSITVGAQLGTWDGTRERDHHDGRASSDALGSISTSRDELARLLTE